MKNNLGKNKESLSFETFDSLFGQGRNGGKQDQLKSPLADLNKEADVILKSGVTALRCLRHTKLGKYLRLLNWPTV